MKVFVKKNILFNLLAITASMSISLASTVSFGDCLNDFHIRQKSVPHNINAEALKEIDHLALIGNPMEGWQRVSVWGDPYAAVAAKVLASKTVFPASFYKKLIATHWLNINGEEIVKINFLATAQQHFRQYVELLHSGFWPDSDQILLSYLTATRSHQLPDITVFDAAWDAAGFNFMRSWQSLNNLPDERIVYPTQACMNISPMEARIILTRDFSELPFKYLLQY